MEKGTKMRTYSINTIDSETTPAWMSIAAKVTPTTQDSGKCRYNVMVAVENEKALISALNADDSVIDYIESIPEPLTVGWCACDYSEGDTYEEVRASNIYPTRGEALDIMISKKYEDVRYVHTDGYLYVDAQ